MAGLSVLLETHSKNQRPGKPAQIISKATLVRGPRLHVSLTSPRPPPATAAASSFLQRCALCRQELGEGRDIYMYRGDMAFCSAECRCWQITIDEDAGREATARPTAPPPCAPGSPPEHRGLLANQSTDSSRQLPAR